MNNLSIMPLYMICAVNDKGRIPKASTQKLSSLVMAGLFEMVLSDTIAIEDKKVRVTGSLPGEKPYLKPLYDFMDKGKPVGLSRIAQDFSYTFSGRRLSALINEVGAHLDRVGMIETIKKPLIGSKKDYIPTSNAIQLVTDKIRKEFLETEEVTQETAVLTILLQTGRSLNPHFSKDEVKDIERKINALLNGAGGDRLKEMIHHVKRMEANITTTDILMMD